MKTTVLLLFSLLLSASASAQVPVLYYDFENNSSRTTLEQTPEQAINSGSTSIVRTYSPPTPIDIAAAGAGIFNHGTSAGTAFSSNKWPGSNPGASTSDYFGFMTNTSGFSGLTLSLDAMASTTGTFLAIAWATNTSTTAPSSSAYVASTTGSLSLSTTFSNLQFSLPAGSENQPYLFLKIYAYNAANNVSNAVMIDNVTLNATTINTSKTLLDYSALGLSLTSGTAFEPTYNNLTVTGIGTTVILGGNLALQGTLSLPSGTLETGTKTLTVKGSISRTSGVISAGSGTVAFSGTVPQSIPSGVFSGAVKNLTINNIQGVTTAANMTVSNTLDLSAGTFALGTTTLSLGGNMTRTSGTINAATGTIAFNGTSSAQTIAAGVFAGTVNNLTVNNSLGVNTAADLTLTGTLALTAGTYNTGSSTQTIKGSITRSAGAINAGNGAMVFSGTTAQSIPANTFTGSIKDLTINNAMGLTPQSDISVSNTLDLATGTLALGTTTLSLGGNVTRSAGSINAATGTVAFNGTSAQTVAAGIFTTTVNNLTVSNEAGVNVNADLTLTGTLALNAGTYNTGTSTQTIKGTITKTSGTVNASNGAFIINGSVAQTIPAGTFTGSVKDLAINNAAGVTTAGNLTVGNSLSLTAGTFAVGSNTVTINGNVAKTAGVIGAGAGGVVFSGTTAQTIPANTFTGGVKDLAINNAAGVTTAGNLTVGNSLSLTAGTFAVGTNTVTINGNVARTAGAISANAGGIVFSGTAAQSVPAGTFTGSVKDLTINNTAGVSTADNTTISNSLVLTGGTYDAGTSTQTISGTINRSAGTINAAAGSLVFNGSAAQNIPAGSVSATIKNLTVANAAGVTINDDYTVATALALQSGFLALNGKTLTLGGTVSGSGSLRGSSASALTVAASGVAGTLNFDQTTDGTTNALALMSVSSGTATLGSKLNIYTALNIAGGTFDLAAKNLVLKSGASKTAYVAEIRGTLAGETNVTVERYIPAWSSRRWRLVTAPVSNTTISAAWQEGSTWNGTTTIPATGTGTLITGQQQGTAAAANAKGFDFWTAIANGAASLRYYAPATTNSQASWQPVSSTVTATAFNSNQAYLLFVRGDRSVYSGTAAGATTLRPTGTLKKGTFTVPVSKANTHTLIGNPYASPLDFKAVYDANNTKIQSSFYIWQASLGSSGGYVLMRPVTAGSSQYEAIPGNGSQSPANRYIHSGEGFFVMPTATATADNAITLKESQKSSATPGISVFRLLGSEDAKLYVNLYDATDNANPVLVDGALTQYNDTYRSAAGDNMVKAINSSENLSIQKTGGDYIVTSGAEPQLGDTLKFRLWNTTSKPYQLELKTVNFTGTGLAPVLGDRFLKKETPLDPNDATTTYSFNVTSDAASKDPSRFYLAFRAAIALPLSITGIKAEAKSTKEVSVQWSVTDETDCKNYQVERSVDAATFTPLATIEKTPGAGEKTYTYLDGQPAAMNYYRVKISGSNGEIKYSAIVKVQLQKANQTMAVYPNPVLGNECSLLLQNRLPGTYSLSLYTMAGQTVLRKTVQYTGGTLAEKLALPQNIGAGVYHLEVKDGSGQRTVQNLQVVK
ncbi:T9SS type A sorting domain-containing protein [Flavisolibacter nicotianae]|uniref:T9SS type A sorting domain-containing protein n=1 Tax=Flavisolibacter nicotianae TaxID=2364882 RepID=UPI000EB01E49|nr:T9SS type A sorting domain-containing protein [Flavisolibacter nicotianae]